MSGEIRLRVTTTAVPFVDCSPIPGNNSVSDKWDQVRAGFDQEAAAVLAARIATWRAASGSESIAEVLRWVDRILIRLCAKFAYFSPGQQDSFRLGNEMIFFPQFLFHLRRSQFLQVCSVCALAQLFVSNFSWVCFALVRFSTIVQMRPLSIVFTCFVRTPPIVCV